MLDESGMLDRFVDAILYGDERKKKGKGGEELEPKGMFKHNMNLLYARYHFGINQTGWQSYSGSRVRLCACMAVGHGWVHGCLLQQSRQFG